VKSISRYKNILISLAIIVIFFFVIKTLWEKQTVMIKALQAKMQELEKGRLLIERWNEISTEYERISRGFFEDEAVFKKFVEDKTKSAGIDVKYLSPSRKEKDFYTEVVINLRATAQNYKNVLDFISELEDKKITVESLRLKNDANNKKPMDMSIKAVILEKR